jgi:ABC-type Fe3+ transport system substrate-binding protein
VKRPRPTEIGGLKTNWKDLLKPNDKPKLNPKSRAVNAPGRESSPDSLATKDDDLDFDGEFADEESLAMLKAVRASKDQHKSGRSQAVTVKADVRGTAKVRIFEFLIGL